MLKHEIGQVNKMSHLLNNYDADYYVLCADY